jgi:hypothetical protein
LVDGHNRIGSKQPGCCGNHECAWKAYGCCRKCLRISEFAAKVQSADKAEQLTQWQTFSPEAACELEVSALIQDISRANAREVRWR